MTIKQIKSASSLLELAAACRSAAKRIDDDVNALKKEAALELSFYLAYETPVDTSRALSNWTVSYGVPTSARRNAYKVGEQGSTKEYSAIRTYRAAKAIISRIPPTVDLYVTNNLSYIHNLNAGSSSQQPTANYVERIEQRVDVKIQKRLRDYINGY